MKSGLRSVQDAQSMFCLPTFKAALAEIATFTDKVREESGFSVYRSLVDGGFIVSECLYGHDGRGGIDSPDINPFVRHGSMKVKEVIFDNKNGAVRKDITALFHTHPEMEWERNLNRLHDYPSSKDLDLTSEINGYNPGHIEGILTVEEGMAKSSLFIYRQVNPNKPNMFARLEGRYPSRSTVLETLEDSGYRYANVLFYPQSKVYRGLGAGLVKLFSA